MTHSTAVRSSTKFGLYGGALVLLGWTTSGMGEGSAALFTWFCAPASLSKWTGLFAPLYWYAFGWAVDERRRRTAIILLALHYLTAPIAIVLGADVRSHGVARELEILRSQILELGWGTTLWYFGCVAMYLAGQIFALRAVSHGGTEIARRR